MNMGSMNRKQAVFEVLALFALTTFLIKGAVFLQSMGFLGGEAAATITTGALIYVPLGWILYKKWGFERFGLTIRGFGAGCRVFLWFSLATLPVFFLGHHVFQTAILGRAFSWFLPEDFGLSVLIEIVGVALPEEFFYRGYLQSRLEEISTPRWSLLGVRFGWGFLVAALLFSLAHSLIAPQFWHFGILLPALGFGWLRLRTKSIAAAVLFHALCNLSMTIAQMSYH